MEAAKTPNLSDKITNQYDITSHNTDRYTDYVSPTLFNLHPPRRQSNTHQHWRQGRETEMHAGFLWGNLEQNDNLCVDGGTILKWIVKK
jgi:hypothetical protein